MSSSGASSAYSDPSPTSAALQQQKGYEQLWSKPAAPPNRDGGPAKGVGKEATGAAPPHRDGGAARAEEDHRYRTCGKCGEQDHWRRVKSELIETPPIKGEGTMAEKGRGPRKEKKGIYNKYFMTCVKCFAEEKG